MAVQVLLGLRMRVVDTRPAITIERAHIPGSMTLADVQPHYGPTYS